MRTFTVFAQALNMRYAVLGFYSSAKCVHYRDKCDQVWEKGPKVGF